MTNLMWIMHISRNLFVSVFTMSHHAVFIFSASFPMPALRHFLFLRWRFFDFCGFVCLLVSFCCPILSCLNVNLLRHMWGCLSHGPRVTCVSQLCSVFKVVKSQTLHCSHSLSLSHKCSSRFPLLASRFTGPSNWSICALIQSANTQILCAMWLDFDLTCFLRCPWWCQAAAKLPCSEQGIFYKDPEASDDSTMCRSGHE